MTICIKMKDVNPLLVPITERQLLEIKGKSVEETARDVRYVRDSVRAMQPGRLKGDSWRAVMVIPADIFCQMRANDPKRFCGANRDEDFAKLWDEFPDMRIPERDDNPWRKRKTR